MKAFLSFGLVVILLISLIYLPACSKDEDKGLATLPPEEAILGKWKEIESSSSDRKSVHAGSGWMQEFLSDGQYRQYKPDGTEVKDDDKEQLYSIDDTCLYYDFSSVDSLMPYRIYKHEFYKNHLRLELIEGYVGYIANPITVHLYEKVD